MFFVVVRIVIFLAMFNQGAWRPSLNLSTLLTSIQLLMAEPNPDDPLMADIVSCISCGVAPVTIILLLCNVFPYSVDIGFFVRYLLYFQACTFIFIVSCLQEASLTLRQPYVVSIMILCTLVEHSFTCVGMQASEFRYNKQLFTQKARKWTEEHAVQKMTVMLLIQLRYI